MEGFPIQLICESRYNKGKFEVNNQAFSKIQEQHELGDRKLIVISIVGEYRRGKSFFLNYIIKYLMFSEDNKDWMDCNTPNDGFKWQGGSTRCTDGIVMWSQAIPFGDEYAVILLDTEGTYDEKTTIQKMSQVFGCSAVISSLQIFNILERITMQTMHEIQFFAEFGRQANENNIGTPFQKLMFLIRDWPYSYEKDYGMEGGSQHLEHWLNSNKDVKNTLKMCYSKTSCYLMPHPGPIVAHASQDIEVIDFNEDFKEHLEKVINIIFSAKTIESRNIGENHLRLKDFPIYFNMIANTMLKCESAPRSLYEAQIYASNMHAYEIALVHYNDLMKKSLNIKKHIKNLEEIHKEHLNSSLSVFDTTPKFGGNTLAIQVREELLQSIADWYDKYKNENDLKQMFENIKNDKDKQILELNLELMQNKHQIELQKQKCVQIEKIFEKDKELFLSISEMDIKQKENEIKNILKFQDQNIKLLNNKFEMEKLHLNKEKQNIQNNLDTKTLQYDDLKTKYLKKSKNYCCKVDSVITLLCHVVTTVKYALIVLLIAIFCEFFLKFI